MRSATRSTSCSALPLLAAICLAAACAPTTPPPKSGPEPALEPQPEPAKEQPVAQPKLTFAPDVAQRLERFAPTALDFDDKLVSAENRKVLAKLVAAAQVIDGIFLDQVSRENRALRARLVKEGAAPEVLEYFDVMYGPWDRTKGDEPFIGERAKPAGAGFYPADLTKQELEAHIEAHPQQAQALRGYFTVVARRDGALAAVPYAEHYREQLGRAAALLREAAAASTHPALKRYLELRAKAFASNDYYESDKAWMDLGDSPIEVVIGPYEVYEDRLMGYKAAFEAFITLRDPVYSARLQKLAKYNERLERALPLARKHFVKRGSASPISVVVELFTAGDTRAGVQTAAFNLPNDERVRAEKGSKKVLLKNVMEAKFNQVLVPISKEVVRADLLERVDFDTYFTDILLHEVAHGMGPGELVLDGRKTSVNAELKELYPAIEECKADVVGLVNGFKLIDLGGLPRQMRKTLATTYLAGVFRAVRFGVEEAHAKSVLVAFNALRAAGAITYDAKSQRFGVDGRRFPKAVRDLAAELLLIQATGDYARAKQLIEERGQVAPEMQQALERLQDIPIDIRPRYMVLEKMKAW